MQTLLDHFHFLRPWLLLLIIPLLWLLYQLKNNQSSLKNWQNLCDPALLSYLQVGNTVKPSKTRLLAPALAGFLAIIAIAGPAWQQLPQAMYREQSALVILLDLSRSMDATDLKPSRLTRAKQKISDVLALKKEGQVGLVVFAGSSFVVTPLTQDNQTIQAQLQGLSTDIMPQQGGNIDAGIAKAMQLLSQASVKHGQLLLFTDSDAYSSQQMQQLSNAGHDLSIIGVGTAGGAPIAKANGGFLTDQQGNIVVPKLNIQRLQSLAKLGHGYFHPLSLDDSDIKPMLSRSLQQRLDQQWQDDAEPAIQTSDQWHEEGAWLLLLVIPLALLGFRRGVLALLFCFTLQPNPAQAWAWQDAWQSDNQQGQSLMQQQDYAQASQTFNDPSWQAAAAYKNQDYTAALQALDNIPQPTADDSYNKGNALAQLGRLEQAIAAYEEALTLNPSLDDAKSNKALLEKQQQDQQKQDQKSQDDKSEQDKSDADKSKSDQSKDKPSENDKTSEQKPNPSDSGQSKPSKNKQDKAKNSEQQSNHPTPKDQQEQAAPQDDEKPAENSVQQHAQPKISAEDIEKSEVNQAFEQSLRRIPDDPAGLLRRKFLYQYQRQKTDQKSASQQQW